MIELTLLHLGQINSYHSLLIHVEFRRKGDVPPFIKAGLILQNLKI